VVKPEDAGRNTILVKSEKRHVGREKDEKSVVGNVMSRAWAFMGDLRVPPQSLKSPRVVIVMVDLDGSNY
jgi:hypothetical protein